jgi:hypothetical protein
VSAAASTKQEETVVSNDETYLPEDYIGAIQFALVGAANPGVAVELIEALVADYPTDPKATRPTKLFVETVQALGGEYRVNQKEPV